LDTAENTGGWLMTNGELLLGYAGSLLLYALQRAPGTAESQTYPYQLLLSVAQKTVSFVVVAAIASLSDVVVAEIAH
jgi:hypothetical protein